MFNKKGFTLTEILIALTIIGVVAALCAPALRGVIPDKTKAAYMKAYNALTVLTDEILGDPSLYWTTYASSGSANCAGFYCYAQPTITPYSSSTNYRYAAKYPMLLSSKMHLLKDPTVNTNTTSSGKVTFYTTDGTEWVFAVTRKSSSTEYIGGYGYVTTLTIDLKPDEDSASNGACTYNSSSCKNPNRFTFKIDNDGRITPTDGLGVAFLKNAASLNSLSEDRESAAES